MLRIWAASSVLSPRACSTLTRTIFSLGVPPSRTAAAASSRLFMPSADDADVRCPMCANRLLPGSYSLIAPMQKRFARRTITRNPEISAILRAAKIRFHGLISSDTRALLTKRKDLVLTKVRNTREKVRKKITIVRENIWTLPNILCWGRIVVSPYVGYLIIDGDYSLALILFVLAGLSDIADGYVARNFASQRTQFGSFLDPAADKVLAACTFLPLAFVGLIPWYLAAVIVGRDACLVSAGFYIRYKSLPPPITLAKFFEASRVTAQLKPTKLSKANTGLQLLLIVATLATHSHGIVDTQFLNYLCGITLTTTIVSGVDYAIRSKGTYQLFTGPRRPKAKGKANSSND